MKALYDRATRRPPVVTPEGEKPPHTTGVFFFISYESLCGVIEKTERVREYETITHLEFEDRGISIRVVTKP
jgi:hypothetical protein